MYNSGCQKKQEQRVARLFPYPDVAKGIALHTDKKVFLRAGSILNVLEFFSCSSAVTPETVCSDGRA